MNIAKLKYTNGAYILFIFTIFATGVSTFLYGVVLLTEHLLPKTIILLFVGAFILMSLLTFLTDHEKEEKK